MNHSSCGQLASAESVQNLRGEQESGPGHTEEAIGAKSSSGLYPVWKLRPGCWARLQSEEGEQRERNPSWKSRISGLSIQVADPSYCQSGKEDLS